MDFLRIRAAAAVSIALLAVTPASAESDSTESVRIFRVESELFPPVIVKGETGLSMSLAERMSFYKVPGLSVAYFDKGRILWTREYGYADVDKRAPVTHDTLFQAGSISKPVAALAALKLAQDGKLDLDEDVNAKLRSWKVPANGFTADKKVTLRTILSHTAGLTVHGFRGYAAGEDVPSVVGVLDGKKPANSDPIRVDQVPGAAFRYSGGGYVVMQALLSDVTGQSFPEILRALVLQPSGMTHSTYEQPPPIQLRSTAAMPYMADGTLWKGGAHTYPELAAAGLWTTPTDLARAAIDVQNAYENGSGAILSQAMAREMLTAQSETQGLGFQLSPPNHRAYFCHGGVNAGFQSMLIAYAESGPGVAIMTNADNGLQLISELQRAIAKEYGWQDWGPEVRTLATVDPKLFDGYVGKYQMAPGPELKVTRKGSHLFTQIAGQPDFEIFPENERTYFFKASPAEITFVTDDKGRATEIVIHQGGIETHAKRRNSWW